MKRTGRRTAVTLALVGALLAPLVALADQNFYQEVDREALGIEDTLTLTVIVKDLPPGEEVQFPATRDFETLSNFQSRQQVFQFGGGGSGIQHIERHTLVLRPLRVGKLTLPPSKIRTARGWLQTNAVSVSVQPGSLGGTARGGARSRPDRMHGMPGMPSMPGFDEDPFDDFFGNMQDERIPRNDSDLFLRAYLDKTDAYAGEQITYSLYVFAREGVDLSTVDAVTSPKMDGFWAEEIESPNRLSGEPRTLDGVPYRAFLLRRRALFAERPGSLDIPASSAEITTGFLFAGRRLHRDGNALKVEVKPLPGGAPADFRPEQVGEWKVSLDAHPVEVELGQPVTVRVSLEGKGNLKRMTVPRLPPLAGLKVYEPTTTDTLAPHQGRIAGKRTQEYLVMPQRTGEFTFPALRLSFFNPHVARYQVTETTPLTFRVKPGANTPPEAQSSTTAVTAPAAKNVLASGAIRPLRAEAEFRAPTRAPWTRPLFWTLTGGPAGAFALVALFGGLRGRAPKEDPVGAQKRKAKAARERLARARGLVEAPADDFYAEVERAMIAWLETRTGVAALGGLTRPELSARLAAAGFPEAQRTHVVALLEACESARYAPGLAFQSRDQVLSDAESILAGGEA